METHVLKLYLKAKNDVFAQNFLGVKKICTPFPKGISTKPETHMIKN